MSAEVNKVFIEPSQERLDCWNMGYDICTTMDKPYDLVIGITRGGAPIAFYVQEFLLKFWDTPIGFATLRTRSYDNIGSAGEVIIGSLEEVRDELRNGTRVLLVDDIFDRGKTIEATIAALHKNFPQVELITIATLYYKPDNCMVDIKPDFFVREYKGDEWVVFPHSISDLNSRGEMESFGVPEKIIKLLVK